MYRLLYCYQNELPTCFDMTTEEMAPFHELSRKMSANPCAVLRQEGGRLEEGAAADLTLADLGEVFQVDRSKFRSKGKNTPFEGWTLHGKIKYTFVGGELKYHD